MTHTVKVKATPRSNVRKNWKQKVKSSWKHQKQNDPTTPYLPVSLDVGSTCKLDNNNIHFWEKHYNKRLGGVDGVTMGNWQHNWRDTIPTDAELKRVKRLMIEKHRSVRLNRMSKYLEMC